MKRDRTVIRFARAAFVALALGSLAAAATPAVAPPAADPDKRAVLGLLPVERDLVLQEMRNFLGVIQTILDALLRNDMATVAKAARTMGSGAANEIPPETVAKLPESFKQMAGTVHMAFDTMALDAESLGEANHTLEQLSGMLQTCNACHLTYQVHTVAPKTTARPKK